MNGIEHILQSIGRVGIVDDRCKAFGGVERFQTSAHAMQRTQRHQDVLRLLAEHDGSTIDSQQVGNIELSDELYAYLPTIDLEIHSLEVTFQDAGAEVGHRTGGIGLHGSAGVLHHEQSVLVVEVRDSKRCLGQHVEEGLLGIAVVLESLMIIQMIAGEVREQSTCKLQSANTLLCDSVAGTLHEGVVATGIDHSCQQTVELNGVGCGVRSGHRLVLDIVADGGEQTAFMPHFAEHII